MPDFASAVTVACTAAVPPLRVIDTFVSLEPSGAIADVVSNESVVTAGAADQEPMYFSMALMNSW